MPRRKTKKREEGLSAIDLANEEMGYVLSLIERTDQSLFLTGKAGTGKSTLLRHICATTHKKFVVLAPTGLAALNVGGQTLHSFFKLPLRPIPPNDPDLSKLFWGKIGVPVNPNKEYCLKDFFRRFCAFPNWER